MQPGAKVRLSGLTQSATLNEAIGKVRIGAALMHSATMLHAQPAARCLSAHVAGWQPHVSAAVTAPVIPAVITAPVITAPFQQSPRCLLHMQVVGEPNDTNGRFPVRLLSPPSAVAQHPGGVRVRESNLERAPDGVVAAALLVGMSAIPAWSCRPTVGAPCDWGPACRGLTSWRPCAVANMLGLPLAYCQLAPRARQSMESLGVYLTVDPVTGAAGGSQDDRLSGAKRKPSTCRHCICSWCSSSRMGQPDL